MAEDLGEKTEEPTAKRREEARQKGSVAKSQDFAAALMAVTIVTLVYLFVDGMLRSSTNLMRYMLDEGSLGQVTVGRLAEDLMVCGVEMFKLSGPLMILMGLVALLGQIYQVGWKMSTQTITPRFERLNLVNGIKKIFSKRSLVKAGLDILKLSVIGTVSYYIVHDSYDEVQALTLLPLAEGVLRAAHIALRVALWVVVILLVLGFIDFRYQRWQTTQDLKMTKHEVKDERKSTEGDVETKRRRLQQARQIALQRIAMDVPQADVVVTNPTHFAVALKYDQTGSMNAPKVVAKGADFLALKIRSIAELNDIPIIERPPLARALYSEVQVGQEIHPQHYEAVAEVLAYVYRLSEIASSN